MKFCIVVLLVTFLIALQSYSQEFDCNVTINAQQLTTEARENLVDYSQHLDFAQQLKQYINSYQWTKEGVGKEKIKCTIEIQFLGSPRPNHYIAQAFIGSLRPIYKTNRNTAVLRILDDSWEFDYVRYQTLTHSDFGFDPLLSFIDFYAYLILGYDFDTFGPMDGTEYFQKAEDIVNKARGAANAGKGWESSGQSTYQRPLLLDELLSEKFHGLREAIYRYHYKGLDLLHKDGPKARKNMLSALEKIRKLLEKVNQRSQATRVFFDSKYLEIANTFLEDPDRSVFTKLARIDPSHQQTYEEYQQKLR